MSTIYKTDVYVTGGRDGRAKSSDGALDVQLQLPKEMGGNGSGTNPEQLFAAGYAACFMGAAKLVAGELGVKLPQDFAIDSHVSLGKCDQGNFRISVAFDIQLKGLDQTDAEKVVAKAHEVCPYSRATRGNIDVDFTINV